MVVNTALLTCNIQGLCDEFLNTYWASVEYSLVPTQWSDMPLDLFVLICIVRFIGFLRSTLTRKEPDSMLARMFAADDGG